MSDYELDGYPVNYNASPESIGRQIQRNRELTKTEEVTAVPIQDNIFYGLKKDLVNFFSNRMEEIKSKDSIQKRIIEKIGDMLEMDELSFEQLMAVYKTISNDARYSTDSLLALFKPVPGVQSVFADSVAQKDEKQDVFDRIYEEMSSEDLENISKIHQLLQIMGKNSEKEV